MNVMALDVLNEICCGYLGKATMIFLCLILIIPGCQNRTNPKKSYSLWSSVYSSGSNKYTQFFDFDLRHSHRNIYFRYPNRFQYDYRFSKLNQCFIVNTVPNIEQFKKNDDDRTSAVKHQFRPHSCQRARIKRSKYNHQKQILFFLFGFVDAVDCGMCGAFALAHCLP